MVALGLSGATVQASTSIDQDTVSTKPKRVRSPDSVYTLDPLQVTTTARRKGYDASFSTAGTKTRTPLQDVPQAITVVTKDQIADQAMQGLADVVRYVPGVTMGQGEGNRDQPTIRGNSTTAGFFTDGMRDDVQFFRDLYNVERVEGLKGSNALAFGRGTGGGVINRVSKEAGWASTHLLTLQGGSYGSRRGSVDIGEGLSGAVAVRVNGMYENSELFRRGASLERIGINPTVTLLAGPATRLTASYERFSDHRTADRGIPSLAGGPAPADRRTFFGDPRLSYSDATVNLGVVTVDHAATSNLTITNRTRFAQYHKRYQNVFPGAVNTAGTEVSLSAYNSAADRGNLFNQTELSYRLATGPIAHTLLAGVEVGRQSTDNFRNTGYFNNSATSISVPFDAPTVSTPVTYRQSATDADNHLHATTASVYLQDQLALSERWRVIGGVRFERFKLAFHNNRTGQDLERSDDLVAPRAGLMFKPAERLSLYSSFSIAHLPSSGDQFASLNAVSETLEPERFANYELGLKWEPTLGLSLTAAAFRLDRTNTTAPDPTDPAKVVQTGSQRSKGLELAISGNLTPAWQIAGGFAWQSAVVTSRTAAAAEGAKVALVPPTTLSLWNRYQVVPRLGLGLGIVHQAAMFAAIDNAVVLPSFVRFDAAGFFAIARGIQAQVNVENLFDRRYFLTSNGNNNISPGSPRAMRISVSTAF